MKKEILESKKKSTVIIDNTNITKDARKPFIELANNLNIAIEYNGLYWHSEIYKKNN